ncbi:enoyl-CoA hydratase-related protein [Nitriliruptor alkaliphilus]|uniref:enoyl-CoA hydratase-related protein n=1 Tax=Nitriliruptor alkaliphilus TaxID=427918 RepID=UPI000698326C|nr:enoyl-CoA hydratase-related protein [Nitriliruptor alkaliphilus]
MSEVLRAESDERGVLTLTIDRPEVKNAFDDQLQEALTKAFSAVGDDVRIVIVTGAGSVFSAGADLNWMRAAVDATFEENVASSRRFEAMLAAVDRCPAPVIARVNGHCLAGALGLVTCADLAVAVRGALFGFSETRLGLAPAMISHYAVRRTGIGAARRYLLTGERFDADRAQALGLLVDVVDDEAALDAAVADLVDALLAAAPGAVRDTKRLLATIAATPDPAATVDARVELISRRRTSEEGQAGMAAFFDRQPAPWVPADR